MKVDLSHAIIPFTDNHLDEVSMKQLMMSMVLFFGQLISMQDKPVVHLKPHSYLIEVGFSGSILEVQNSPEHLLLPEFPPKPDPQGNQWSLDIKNFGPHPVQVEDKLHFSLRVGVNETVHIYSSGTAYYVKR